MHTTAELPTEMYIRQVTPDTYRQVLRAIRQKEIYKIIVDTNSENIKSFFRAVSTLNIFLVTYITFRFIYYFQILQLQMNDYRYHYMFTTFVSIVIVVFLMLDYCFYVNLLRMVCYVL